ncbi:hypothetical protein LTR78_001824 [Recurvomyces mirabilis]|uniref:HECT-type E3 ubiquitin transferase n=1 Tax=Recurvomyces mirabilis TaxID=574656 RepID=A0AAE0WVD8_9PEZI|nr:hypothetical protein LTR78_001824 [Recurvomyces mirabilis]KAK5156736.1 hypothetical protein LTS14_004948 [Recurvomyces mirabilis]
MASADEKRDPSSFQQLFCDTFSIRKICTPQADGIKVDPSGLEHYHRAVNTLLRPFSSAGGNIVSNKTAATIMNAALQTCLADAPSGSPQQYVFANRLISAGHAYPACDQRTPADAKWNIWLRILDHVEIEKPTSRLLVHILQVVAFRSQLDDRASDMTNCMRDPNGQSAMLYRAFSTIGPTNKLNVELDPLAHKLGSSYHTRSMIMRLVAHTTEMSESTLLCFVLWLKKLFLTHWRGTPVVQRDNVEFAALFLIDAIKNKTDTISPAMLDYYLIEGVSTRLSSLEIAQSWTELASRCGVADCSHMPWYIGSYASETQRSSKLDREVVLPYSPAVCHLLQFDFLFTTTQRAVYFRSINWQRMLQAWSVSEKASGNRQRTESSRLRIQQPDGRLRHNEEQALVLKIRRDHVLQDAYDQLWQRRNNELFRPLRVWMAEADDLELGQDLGGVQIEFFNLVCREAYAEDAGMFTTNDATGTNYLRPGSIQPLHKFELLGTLLALAAYNGITLPISMHETFYRILLDGPVGRKPSIWPPSFISDWPVESSSLEYMLDHAEEDIDDGFSLEANGLRVSASYGGRFRTGDEYTHTMNVYQAVPMYGSSAGMDVSELKWPGWRMIQVPENAPPITDWKKFAEKYMLWMAYYSVVPQWEALMKGFYRIIDPHTLSIFTPAELKHHIEGTSNLDIQELRRATRYEGYVANEPYIQAFWRVISTWSEAEQMGLVKFVTAAERVPIGGEKDITFVIQHSPGTDDERLPTSSTCFGTLNLPVYSSADILNTKLTMAVKYGMEGFGVA